jgi:hypothetical protein
VDSVLVRADTEDVGDEGLTIQADAALKAGFVQRLGLKNRCPFTSAQKKGKVLFIDHRIASLYVAALIAGCASASGVIATGPETYMVTGQADLGPNKTAAARQAAIEAANEHCAKLGKRPAVESATNEDVGSAGVFQLRGGTTYTFRCIEKAK